MSESRTTVAKALARNTLGALLVTAGVGHLSFARQEFQAQVPRWVPFDTDTVVLASGVAEIGLGAALVVARRDPARAFVGAVAAGFFTAVFPGNLSQWRNHRDAFGLTTDRRRAVRMAFQPLLVGWALWATRPD